MLLNLIINSLHAMPDGGEVAISVGPAEGCPVPSAVIEVADTGSGVPEAIRPRLFDSFLSGRPDGTGLGLAIARRIVESHRGEIALNGTGPRGTAFRITLPLAG